MKISKILMTNEDPNFGIRVLRVKPLESDLSPDELLYTKQTNSSFSSSLVVFKRAKVGLRVDQLVEFLVRDSTLKQRYKHGFDLTKRESRIYHSRAS